MIPLSRVLRKTKAVISPGKKAGESKKEYQMRYLQWWVENHGDQLKTSVSPESMDTMGDLAEANDISLSVEPILDNLLEPTIEGKSYQEAFAVKPAIIPQKLGATRDGDVAH